MSTLSNIQRHAVDLINDSAAREHLDTDQALAILLDLAEYTDPMPDLLAALRLALPAVAMFTGNGARDWPADAPRDENGDINMDAVAHHLRAALAKAEG